MRCPICGTYMGTLGNGACGVCAEKYLHLAPPPSEVERLRVENEALKHDIARHVAICAEQATEIERLMQNISDDKKLLMDALESLQARREKITRLEAENERMREVIVHLRDEFPQIEGAIDENTHTAEWALQYDRVRLHTILDAKGDMKKDFIDDARITWPHLFKWVPTDGLRFVLRGEPIGETVEREVRITVERQVRILQQEWAEMFDGTLTDETEWRDVPLVEEK